MTMAIPVKPNRKSVQVNVSVSKSSTFSIFNTPLSISREISKIMSSNIFLHYIIDRNHQTQT
jgi:hypothetical protein